MTVWKQKDRAFGMVVVGAYIGILIKHLGPSGYNGEYTGVILTVSASVVLLAVSVVFLAKKRLVYKKVEKENGA